MTPDDLTLLAGEIMRNVVRNDNPHHPVFQGCYDWHSAVHGFYSLYVIRALTGDSAYAGRVSLLLNGARFADEKRNFDDERFATPDIPEGREYVWSYGYGWLLRLSAEYISNAGTSEANAILPLATAAAGVLNREVFGLSESEKEGHVNDPEYRNLCWKVLCLRDWGRQCGTGEARPVGEYRRFTKDHIMPKPGDGFPGPDTEAIKGFFSPSLMRALLILSLLHGEDHSAWLPAMRKSVERLEPVIVVPGRENAHTAGLNFSRAWGLAALYAYTCDDLYANSWKKHVDAQMDQVKTWMRQAASGSDESMRVYDHYMHWVPQFGVLSAYFGQQAGIVPSKHFDCSQRSVDFNAATSHPDFHAGLQI